MEDTKIFDRIDILDTLHKRLNGLKEGYRQNVALIGSELIGKTKILKYFLYRIDDPEIIPIYIETNKISFEIFLDKFIGALLYNYLKNFENIIMENKLNDLIQKARDLIPNTVEKIEFIRTMQHDKRKKEEIFLALLKLPDILNKETNKFSVIIFDEFQGIQNLGIRKPYHAWSKLIMLQRHVMYVISSSQKYMARRIMQESLTLLFGNFEILDINPFSLKMSKEFIETKIYPFKLEGNLKEFIINFTGGIPFYLEQICREIIARAQENNLSIINESILVQALENLLIGDWGIFNQRFSHIIKDLGTLEKKNQLSTILLTAASGFNKIKDISAELHLSAKTISARLNRLQELDFIYKNGDFYYINDKVFSFWLRSVYKESSSSIDVKERMLKFRQILSNDMKKFSEHSNLDLINRIINLFNLFANEVINLENKKIRLSRFREIKPIEFKNKNIHQGLIARSSDTIWLMAIKQTGLEEDDVLDFLTESKKFNRVKPRKIIISYDKSDANAKVLAKEKNVLLWDLDDVNRIFDIYNKPRIINI